MIKKGYKETKIGISDENKVSVDFENQRFSKIPEDWEVKRLGEIITFQRGYDLPNNCRKKGSYPIVASNGIVGYHNEYKVKNGGITIGRSGNLGEPFYICESFWPLNTTLYIKKFHNSYPRYIYYLLKTLNLKRYNSGSAVPSLNRNYIHPIKISVPPLKEQQKIAEILTKWDNHIETLENLISKKEEYKKGLMQNLLTGKVRFPGFNEEWKEVKLGDISEIVTGTTPSTKLKEYYENGTYPWITPTDITYNKYISKSERYLTIQGLSKGRKLPSGSLLITCIASIGKNAILTKTGSCNQQINAILPSSKNNIEFLYYLIEYNKEYLLKYAGHSATPILNKKSFSNLKFTIPPLKEQEKIAEILSLQDKEIEILKEKLELLKMQKKGLCRSF
ncbi:type I restriction enzyme S subunit [Methanococcus voltae]|uniref:restriction endonuclease subunit S n=1 Tax=Methanococcus voltae TaxID=2188 RepID=UPI001AE466E8|nr:restriction endonuclease subunit S [Methanococcus voltae]MBP2144051.1 type I restriction enzyme S subunit [Methanococcus voltae]